MEKKLIRIHQYKQLATLLLALAITGCTATSVPVATSNRGAAVSEAQMIKALQLPGKLVFAKHVAATWEVPLSGLVNLDHPVAERAGLKDRDEPIEIYTYSLVHPEHGAFLVDSGVASSFQNPGSNDDVSRIVKMGMNIQKLKLLKSTAEIVESLGGINGVFLTHIHLDHIMGLTDLDQSVPVYLGPGDAKLRTMMNLFTQGTTNRLLSQRDNLLSWDYSQSGYLDVFGDGSLFAIHAPGHTPGTTVYLANTTTGVQFMIGDVTHTGWGWQNQVEPGTYSVDQPLSAESLSDIHQLTTKLSNAKIHPGHQSL